MGWIAKNIGIWCAAALLPALAAVAEAGIVTITNAGFEAQVLANGSTGGVPTGWTGVGNAFTWNPPAGVLSPEAYEGSIVGMTQSGGSSLAQTLSELLTSGTTYSLSVAVGQRSDFTLIAFDIQLRADGLTLAHVDQTSAPPLPVGSGAWGVYTLSYTATGSDIKLGKALEIRLVNGGGAPQVAWDDVRMSTSVATAVPLPSAAWMGLSLLGTAGACAWLRRRRASLLA